MDSLASPRVPGDHHFRHRQRYASGFYDNSFRSPASFHARGGAISASLLFLIFWRIATGSIISRAAICSPILSEIGRPQLKIEIFHAWRPARYEYTRPKTIWFISWPGPFEAYDAIIIRSGFWLPVRLRKPCHARGDASYSKCIGDDAGPHMIASRFSNLFEAPYEVIYSWRGGEWSSREWSP